MREIQLLAERCRLSTGDLVGLSREVAGGTVVRGPEDLTADQQRLLIAWLRIMAAPAILDDYFLTSAA